MKYVLAGGLVLIALGALAIRLPRLEQRPLHTDEAVHALKFKGLWESGTYRYDPAEYHGPSLYYLTWPMARLSRAATFAELGEGTLRCVPVVFGVGLVLLLPLVASGQGRWETVWAGVLTAVSPAMVFYSRYYIHETLLVFFTFLLLAAGWRYYRSGKVGWALLAGLALGMMVATKETFVLELAAMGGALILVRIWGRGCPAGDHGGGAGLRWGHLVAALTVAAVVWVVFFTSLFTNPAGLLDSVRTYAPWFERAEGASPHNHPWHYYLGMLGYWRVGRGPTWSEGLILGLAVVGCIAALARRGGGDSGWARFIAFYTILLTAVYSAIPYKTPWCMLGFLQGLILLAGLGAAWLIGLARMASVRAAVAALVAVATGQLAVQAYRASYVYFDSPRNPYVYAHTLSNVLGVVDKAEALARVDARGHELVIKVMVRGGDYWPLPWYLRRFDRVGWWGELADDPVAPVVIVSPAFAPALEATLGDTHQMAGYYGLRPGVFLQLYVERGLWERYLERVEEAVSER